VAADDELVGPIKLPDADIDTVLGLLEIYTGRIILRPQQLPTATYHLVIDRKIPKSEAVLALQTILSLNQVGVVPLGDKFLKVVALAQAKTEAPEMIMGSTLDLPASGRIATKLFQLQFLRVNEFVPQITPLMTPGVANGIVALDKTNAVLVTDTLSNLQRVETLLQHLDQPSMAGLTPKFYPLRNGAKASDVVAKLRAMFQGPLQAQLGAAISYSADDRTNQIIVLADSRQIPLFDDLITKLDVKADPNTRNEVIFLKHASAKDVAPLLSQLVSGQTSAAQKSGSVTRGALPQPNPPAPTPAQPAAAAVAIADSTNEFSNLLTILPDERSNSIVVSGTVDDIRLLRELVDKLDVLLAQVSIQVVIAEVTLSDTDVNGISALNLTVGPNAKGGTSITNFDGAVGGWGVASGVVNPLAFKAAMGNVGQKGNVKVLNANTIVTTHNKEAEFVVSQQQPIITSQTQAPLSSTTTLTNDNPFANMSQVTYKDIGIDVKVTPLIGDDGSIQLKIDQKVDDVVRTININGVDQPIIGHRQATSFINVHDGQMVVLGGLQTSKHSINRTKLGFLYEIPILSNLLGGRNNETSRTELLLFVRPHVIPAHEGTADTTKQIDALSNKEQVDQFLNDPSKETHQKLLDKYYK
jgi:general secretion pathway protein D